MKLAIIKGHEQLKENDVIAFFLTEESTKTFKKNAQPQYQEYVALLDLQYFKGKLSEISLHTISKVPTIILCGLGKEEDVTTEAMRNAASSITDICREKSIDTVSLVVPQVILKEDITVTEALAEGLTLSNYSFDKYKSHNEEDKKPLLKKGIFISSDNNITSKLKEIEILSENTLLCRDLVNECSDRATSVDIASIAKKLSTVEGVSCQVLGKSDIEKHKMGLLLAVNRGSPKPPQLVILKYTGNKNSKSYFALVGKGVTFDSGGYNLKPAGSMETMRSDMAGAASVLYTIKAAAELKLKKNFYGVFPLTDNMVAANAYRPGDIFTAYNGKSVEIGNTDAEGRLILADALSYVEKKLKPKAVADIATLTGSCLVALGESVAAYISEDEELQNLIEKSASKTGESIWRMPYIKEYEKNIKSDFADMKNIAGNRHAGTVIGAIFLKNFIENPKWIHIDIAGTSWYSEKRGYRSKNATGYGVRLFIDMLKNWKG